MTERIQETGVGQGRHGEIAQLVQSGFDALVEEMQQGDSERFLRYLEFCSRFHRYSPVNQMLIFMQKPEALLVAGYARWQSLGYQVRRGEKAIKIFAPVLVQEQAEEGAVREVVKGYKLVNVFDVSQLANLEENPLPLPWEALPDDRQELYLVLKLAAGAEGIDVRERPMGPGHFGTSHGGRITVNEDLDSRNKIMVLVHEWVHELLHRKDRSLPRPVRECQAEAASYVVAHYLGLPHPNARDYLRVYSNTAETLLENFDAVRSVAHTIIQQIEKQVTQSGPRRACDHPDADAAMDG